MFQFQVNQNTLTIFFFGHEKILEAANEYLKHMFHAEIRKIFT